MGCRGLKCDGIAKGNGKPLLDADADLVPVSVDSGVRA